MILFVVVLDPHLKALVYGVDQAELQRGAVRVLREDDALREDPRAL